MRLIALFAVLVGSAVSLQAADTLRSNVGVGIGTMIFEGNDGLLSQVAAATTNGTSMNQTFAITSGTSGADDWDGLVGYYELREFVTDNMDAVAANIARGEGEALDAMGDILALDSEQRDEFTKTLRSNFAQIYDNPEVTSDVVSDRIFRMAPQPAIEEDLAS